jgi:hypothetical protein
METPKLYNIIHDSNCLEILIAHGNTGMESHGVPGIHCSLQTADRLMVVGKNAWLKPRYSTINAKGKGELEIYWIEPGKSGTAQTPIRNGFPQKILKPKNTIDLFQWIDSQFVASNLNID